MRSLTRRWPEKVLLPLISSLCQEAYLQGAQSTCSALDFLNHSRTPLPLRDGELLRRGLSLGFDLETEAGSSDCATGPCGLFCARHDSHVGECGLRADGRIPAP